MEPPHPGAQHHRQLTRCGASRPIRMKPVAASRHRRAEREAIAAERVERRPRRERPDRAAERSEEKHGAEKRAMRARPEQFGHGRRDRGKKSAVRNAVGRGEHEQHPRCLGELQPDQAGEQEAIAGEQCTAAADPVDRGTHRQASQQADAANGGEQACRARPREPEVDRMRDDMHRDGPKAGDDHGLGRAQQPHGRQAQGGAVGQVGRRPRGWRWMAPLATRAWLRCRPPRCPDRGA